MCIELSNYSERLYKLFLEIIKLDNVPTYNFTFSKKFLQKDMNKLNFEQIKGNDIYETYAHLPYKMRTYK